MWFKENFDSKEIKNVFNGFKQNHSNKAIYFVFSL